jgi:hypothetical protein
MGKIKRDLAELKEGINQQASGSLTVIEIVRNGVIRGLKQSIHVKRPNQYPK